MKNTNATASVRNVGFAPTTCVAKMLAKTSAKATTLAKAFAPLAESAKTQFAQALLALKNAPVTTNAQAFAPFAESALTKLAEKTLAPTSATATTFHHTFAKALARCAENAPIKNAPRTSA